MNHQRNGDEAVLCIHAIAIILTIVNIIGILCKIVKEKVTLSSDDFSCPFSLSYLSCQFQYENNVLHRKIYGDQASYFDMEMKPKIKHTKRGLISFVNNGNNQHGSQVNIAFYSF